MEMTAQMVVIVVLGVFLAGLMDGIAGGGGLISVPAYFLAGLPAHLTLGTNKFSSCIGTAVSAGRFIRGGYVKWKLAIPSVVLAIVGAHFGTRLQLTVDERYLKWVLLFVLPVVALVVLRQRQFPEEPGQIEPKKQAAIVLGASLIIGTYDGFYGPGTGTFLLLVFCHLGKMDVRTAAGNVKVVNLASNASALVTSLLSGKVFLALGLIAAAASIAGHYLGSGLAIKDGSKIVRPMVLVVLGILAVKVIWELVA
ncbi:MAG: TSUP family transporter [Oscillospiraceae bacterium]|nr:TSUP family transporter [Oscillospiraceae bacterium]